MGNRFFLESGAEVNLIADLKNGSFCVESILTDEEYDEECTGSQFITNQIFKKPPVQKLNKDIQEKEGYIKELSDKIEKLNQTLSEKNKEKENFDKFLKEQKNNHPEFSLLLDFLNKENLFLVKNYYGVLATNSCLQYKGANERGKNDECGSKFAVEFIFGGEKPTIKISDLREHMGSYKDILLISKSKNECKIYIKKAVNEGIISLKEKSLDCGEAKDLIETIEINSLEGFEDFCLKYKEEKEGNQIKALDDKIKALELEKSLY